MHVRNQLYLIGTQRLNLEQKFQSVIVKIGHGFERFDAYVPQNQSKQQRALIELMAKSEECLEVVVERLARGENIRRKVESSSPAKKNTFVNLQRKVGVVKQVAVRLGTDRSNSSLSRQSSNSDNKSISSRGGSQSMRARHMLNQKIYQSLHTTRHSVGAHKTELSMAQSIPQSMDEFGMTFVDPP